MSPYIYRLYIKDFSPLHSPLPWEPLGFAYEQHAILRKYTVIVLSIEVLTTCYGSKSLATYIFVQ